MLSAAGAYHYGLGYHGRLMPRLSRTPRAQSLAGEGVEPSGASALSARSDDELMELARAGERSAFAVLVERHQKSLLRFACKRVGAANARDAAQNAFVELYRSL